MMRATREMDRVMRKPALWNAKSAVSALVVIGGLLLATDAQAQRLCSQDPLITGRTCPEAVCIALQDQVDLLCKTPAPTSCNSISGCSALQAMRARWVACRDARVEINVTCWGGGNAGHQQAVNQCNINISNCDARIALPEPTGCADPCP
jgi:hypothetical protein